MPDYPDYLLSKILPSHSELNKFISHQITHILKCCQAIVSLTAHFIPDHADYSQSKMLPHYIEVDSLFYARSFRLLTS